MRGMKRYMLATLPETLDSERHCRRKVCFAEPTSADQATASPPAYYDTSDVLICAFVIGCVIGYLFNAALMRGVDWAASATGREVPQGGDEYPSTWARSVEITSRKMVALKKCHDAGSSRERQLSFWILIPQSSAKLSPKGPEEARWVYQATQQLFVSRRYKHIPTKPQDGSAIFPGTGIPPCPVETIEVGHDAQKGLILQTNNVLLDGHCPKADKITELDSYDAEDKDLVAAGPKGKDKKKKPSAFPAGAHRLVSLVSFDGRAGPHAAI